MPELPEVETIVRFLRPKLRGRTIRGFWTNTPRVLRFLLKPTELRPALGGKKIQGLMRLGKNIILKLSGPRDLVVHLMMSGRLLWNPDESYRRHIRFYLGLDHGDQLALHDIRKFGWVRLVPKGEYEELGIGPDALSITPEEFRRRLQTHRTAIKTSLLNQKIVAGIGNIYADEILWKAGIHPRRPGSSLGKGEIERIYRCMHKVLQRAIRAEGTSARDYRKPDGTEGGYFWIRRVYRRTGERCRRDGAIIQRVVIGQRSSHFCPRHQH